MDWDCFFGVHPSQYSVWLCQLPHWKGEEMNQNLVLTIVELVISLIVEGVILAMVFQWISNKSTEQQQQHLQHEMENLEKQNKFDYEQIMSAINQNRLDIISQIKESRLIK